MLNSGKVIEDRLKNVPFIMDLFRQTLEQISQLTLALTGKTIDLIPMSSSIATTGP